MVNKQPTSWTDELLIREIRAGGQRCNKALEYIYKAWRGYYLSPVLKRQGTPEEVDVVLSEVLMDLVNVVHKGLVLETATLRTYFVTAVIRAWSKSRVVANRQQTVELDTKHHNQGQRDSVEEDFIRQERMQKLDALLTRLGEKCKYILMQAAKGYSMREIADDLNFANEQSAKNSKRECHRKLLELTDKL